VPKSFQLLGIGLGFDEVQALVKNSNGTYFVLGHAGEESEGVWLRMADADDPIRSGFSAGVIVYTRYGGRRMATRVFTYAAFRRMEREYGPWRAATLATK